MDCDGSSLTIVKNVRHQVLIIFLPEEAVGYLRFSIVLKDSRDSDDVLVRIFKTRMSTQAIRRLQFSENGRWPGLRSTT